MGLVLIGIAIAAAIVAVEFDTAFLNVLPALFAVAILLLRPHLGEVLVEAIARRKLRRPAGRALATHVLRRRTRAGSGGRLIALCLGGRAPPQPAG